MNQMLFLSGLICISMALKHEFHVSITDIHLKQDTLQVAVKLFTHDLEEELKESNGQAVFLDQSSDMEKSFRIIRAYCSPRFSLGSASDTYQMEWIGHEYEEDVCWVYGYAILDTSSSVLFVRNTLLDGGHHDQHNMIHFSSNGSIQSKIATRDKPDVRFLLE